nr:glycoprotein vOX2-2 [Elephant endotheliotropic herpesvirus 5A]
MYSLTCVFVLTYIIYKAEGFVETFNISSLPHENVTLKCTFNDTKNIFAIQWKKETVNQSSDIATIKEINENTENKRPEITYFNHSNINVTCEKNMRTTTLTIVNITRQNEGCFTCIFRVNGKTSTEYTNKSCINLHDNPTISIMSTLSDSQSQINITCLSTGYFNPSVKWINVSGVNNLTENVTNYNGTTSVKNTIYDIVKEEICCKNHIGNVTCIKMHKIHKGNLNEIITSTCIVFLIIITALWITIYWYYVERRKKRTKNTDYTKMKL